MPRAHAVGVGSGVGVRVKQEEDAVSPPPAPTAAPPPPSPKQQRRRRQPGSAVVAVKKEVKPGPGALVVKRENAVSGPRDERGGRLRAASSSGTRSDGTGPTAVGPALEREKLSAGSQTAGFLDFRSIASIIVLLLV